MIYCKYCGGETEEREKPFTSNGKEYKHIGIYCVKKCRGDEGWQKWISQHNPDKDFIMPFGKYKDKNIEEIVKIDKNYAIWASDNLQSDKIKQKFKEVLKKE